MGRHARKERKNNRHKPTFIDLCCGAGGLAYGFKKAGWKPLLGIDNCQYSLTTFGRNIVPKTLNLNLVGREVYKRILKEADGARPDAVMAGPPCQGFSRAGPRDSTDPRNRVFVSCARIAVALKPKVILLENVPNITTSKFKRVLQRASKVLREGGYAVDRVIINARNFGVPQHRARIVFVAVTKKMKGTLAGFVKELLKHTAPPVTVASALVDLSANGRSCNQPANHDPMNHSKRVRAKIAKIKPGEGPLSYRKLDPSSVASTLVCGHRALPCHFKEPRTITVREAARLQSFPDTFVFEGPRGNQMQQVANAVPPQMARGIAVALRALVAEVGGGGVRVRVAPATVGERRSRSAIKNGRRN